MDNCIFCKIVNGDIPSFKVAEDSNFYAFLSISPHTQGHTLVIPKKHVDYFFDIEDSNLREILMFSKKIQQKLLNSFKPKTNKVGIAVAGLEVPHAHLHLIPLHEMGDLDFSAAKPASQEELEQTLKKITE